MQEEQWEIVVSDATNRVRRLAVHGGHLYQVERFDTHEGAGYQSVTEYNSGWHPPVFVPGPT